MQGWLDALKKGASAARGWVMLGYDLNDGSLFNYIMDSQNLWAVYNMTPVLDWDHVNRQLAQAEGAKEGADRARRSTR